MTDNSACEIQRNGTRPAQHHGKEEKWPGFISGCRDCVHVMVEQLKVTQVTPVLIVSVSTNDLGNTCLSHTTTCLPITSCVWDKTSLIIIIIWLFYTTTEP